MLIVLRYFSYLQREDVAILPPADVQDVCCVCLLRAAPLDEVQGPAIEWHQAEPCRHWMCGQCSRAADVLAADMRCNICRDQVAGCEVGVSLGAKR
jgi:hypothetical protein